RQRAGPQLRARHHGDRRPADRQAREALGLKAGPALPPVRQDRGRGRPQAHRPLPVWRAVRGPPEAADPRGPRRARPAAAPHAPRAGPRAAPARRARAAGVGRGPRRLLERLDAMGLLDEIVARKRVDIVARRAAVPRGTLATRAAALPPPRSLAAALTP